MAVAIEAPMDRAGPRSTGRPAASGGSGGGTTGSWPRVAVLALMPLAVLAAGWVACAVLGVQPAPITAHPRPPGEVARWLAAKHQYAYA